tara:strand:- start:21 stop:1085 length:1065 start_codon:yes stop_codon:yes gene_type:complete
MAFTTIDDPSKYFQTLLYTGDGGSNRTINFDGNSDLQPDFLWVKRRNTAQNHYLANTSDSISKVMYSNDTGTEANETSQFKSVHSDGWVQGSDNTNTNTHTYVAWAWKCNGGTSTASASESGSNVAYNFQVNTTSKFMINLYTGLGSDATLNLGNQFTPAWMIFKNRDQADDWVVYHHKNTSDPDTDHLHLNTDAATADDQEMFEDQNFAADEINIGTNHEVNADGEKYVAYAWAEVQGFSKFGEYTGNGNANGPFVYTGFKPAFVILKPSSAQSNWFMIDSTREPINPAGNKFLYGDADTAEVSSDKSVDLLSNGFKCRAATGFHNDNGESYLYMAFAEQPFTSSKGVPANAR